MLWKRLHGIFFRKLPHIQTLLKLHCFHSLDVHIGRSASLLTCINVQLFIQNLSSVDQNQLSHSISHNPRIYLASDKSSGLRKKQASTINGKCPSKSIQNQIPWLPALPQNVSYPLYILLLRSHQKLESRFALLHLIHALFF